MWLGVSCGIRELFQSDWNSLSLTKQASDRREVDESEDADAKQQEHSTWTAVSMLGDVGRVVPSIGP